jgi:hypothetical protein
MAVRKETIKQQFAEAVQQHLESGEQLETGAWAVQGPSPLWVSGLFGIVGMIIADVRYHYVWVTDRRVIFLKGSFWTARPKGFAWSDLRSAVGVSDVTPAATWSWFRYHRPAGGKPPRLNFARPWREEFGQITAALGGAGATAAVPVPPA